MLEFKAARLFCISLGTIKAFFSAKQIAETFLNVNCTKAI